MKLQVRYANHPEDSKHYTTEELRRHYLMEKVFEADEILLVYSHQDRIISGGIMPVKKALPLETSDELRAAYFLERRELGIINIGGAGTVTLDGQVYNVKSKDGMYVGMGTKEVVFASVDENNPIFLLVLLILLIQHIILILKKQITVQLVKQKH